MRTIADGYTKKTVGSLLAINEIAWLRGLWLLTVFMLLCGFAFFAIPLGGFHITAGRVLLIMFLYLFLLAFFLRLGKMEAKIKVGKYLLFLALWVLWAILSLFWVPPTVNAARHIEGLIIGTILVALSLLFLSTENGVKDIYLLWVVATIAFVVIGIWELVTETHLGEPAWYEMLGIHYPRAVFFHFNVFDVFLTLSFPFLYIFMVYSKNIFAKVAGLLAILVGFYFIVLSGSRASILGVLVSLFIIFLMTRWKDKFKFVVVGLVVAGILLISSQSLSLANNPTYVGVMQSVPEQITSIKGPGATFDRLNLIRNGLRFLEDSHFLGVGAGGFEYYMTKDVSYYTHETVDPHNWWLEVLANYGVLIFSLFLVFYLGILWNLLLISRRSKSQTLRLVSSATFVSLVAFSIANTSASQLMRNYVVWLLFATALCVMNSYRLEKEKAESAKG